MPDPLADIVTLLQPRAPFSKHVRTSGPWHVHREDSGQPFYCVLLEGRCLLQADGQPPTTLQAGDFALIPSAHGFAFSSLDPPPAPDAPASTIVARDGQVQLGNPDAPANAEMTLGHCIFDSPDATLLVPLLPSLVLVRGDQRLSTLVQLLRDEVRARRPARQVILERLLEVLLIEALRASAGTDASAGLLRGLADERLSFALRAIHTHPTRPWTVAQLASEAALSRSAFFERFHRAVGMAPMEYLLTWRMALAKDLLRKQDSTVTEIAQRVGYSSVSTFSVAFARHVGMPPTHFARTQPARTELA